MDTPESIKEKARLFFLDYCQSLSAELNNLTMTTVTCTLNKVGLLRGIGELEPLFAADRSVARAEEDSLGLGDLHLVFDTAISIALAGMMMMTSEPVIRSKMESREYDDEIHEGFREVSTQIVASLNRLLEEKTEQGGHIFLTTVKRGGQDNLPITLEDDITYLMASIDVAVAEFESATAYWLISRRFAEAILKISIPGSSREMAEASGAEPDEELPGEEEEELELPHTAPGELLAPQVAGSVRLVMTETPFTLKEEEKVMRGITAITQDGYRYIGIERKGTLIRVLSQSDMYQVMGFFYGSGPPSPRDKALHALPIGKFNTQQNLVKIAVNGSIDEAADLLQRNKLHALPVVSNRGTLRGFVPIHAVLDYYRRMGKR
ncbi:MAG: CBS domain-containing protein [Magnetococcus sp. DMHC-8]